MLENYKQLEISQLLVRWFMQNQRNMPWRETNDPYKIWVSEIILQQTRVSQGLNYYLEFIDKFPTVKTLSEASESEVLKAWQGLGYYTRARNMHATSKVVVEIFDGKLPDNYKEIISLKGIGEYTAAAILSIAFNKPYAVVDGNVFRVLSRLFAIDSPIDSSLGQKQFAQLAQNVLDISNPGLHNQAMMEFGALHCTPSQPLCESCPLKHLCIAKMLNKQTDFPVKQKKSKVRKRYFHYFNIDLHGYTFLNKRKGNDIWKNMYEFPLIETEMETDFSELLQNESFKVLFNETEVTFLVTQKQVKHVLTHQHIYANFYEVEAVHISSYFDEIFLKIKSDDIHQYPVSRLIHRYLERK
ncbi:MAG: A/G-specific adenine glycosylase [Candidatus Saccharimonadaceae bacterium]